jgi:hypothetical protein
MNDVVYRINTLAPVKMQGTIVVAASPQISGAFKFYRGEERTIANETAVGTGLVNRFDDPTYYTA